MQNGQDLMKYLGTCQVNTLRQSETYTYLYGSDNSLSPVLCQAIFWTNDDLLPTGPLGSNSEIWIKNMSNFICLLNISHFSVSLRVLAVPIYCIFPSSSPHSTRALWPLGGLCMLFIFHAVINSTNLARHKECHTSQASSILHRLLVCMHGWGSAKLGYLWYAGDNTVYTSEPMVISVWRCCLPSIGIPIIMTDLSFYNGNQYTWKDQDSPVVGV